MRPAIVLAITLAVFGTIFVPASTIPAHAQAATEAPKRDKKLIYYGWGTRDTRYVREHWRDMEQMPFDGIGINVAIDRSKPTEGDETTPNVLAWNVFGPRAFRLEDFRPAIDDLKAAKWQKFTDNFMVACISSEGQDFGFHWFDDARWKTCLNNWRILTTIAKEGGCKGIILDPEHYTARFFNYPWMKKRVDKPFNEYAARVRERGRELMTVMRQIFPADLTILCLFGHTLVWNYARDTENTKLVKPVQEMEYALYPAFLDGMLEAASPRARIVDGYEFAYGFKDRDEFEEAYDDIKRKAEQLSTTPKHYRQHIEAGFGLWLDYGGTKRWSTTDEHLLAMVTII